MRVCRPPQVQIFIERVPYNRFKHDRGEFYVGPGRHEIEIRTEEAPKHVWLSMSSEDSSIPVCLAEVDMCSATIVGVDGDEHEHGHGHGHGHGHREHGWTGFIVHALVYSTGTTICWLADLE